MWSSSSTSSHRRVTGPFDTGHLDLWSTGSPDRQFTTPLDHRITSPPRPSRSATWSLARGHPRPGTSLCVERSTVCLGTIGSASGARQSQSIRSMIVGKGDGHGTRRQDGSHLVDVSHSCAELVCRTDNQRHFSENVKVLLRSPSWS